MLVEFFINWNHYIIIQWHKENDYVSMIQSHLNFMIEAWGSAPPIRLQILQVNQNRALRIVFDIPNQTYRNDIYSNLVKGLLTIRSLYVLSVSKFLFLRSWSNTVLVKYFLRLLHMIILDQDVEQSTKIHMSFHILALLFTHCQVTVRSQEVLFINFTWALH